ncbi:MAG: putative membrane protein YdfJ with MMPL/SSD domain, partial [Halovenus sp.]
APATYTLRKRWNWWVGSLELAYGDTYRRFRVRDTAD